MVLEFCEEILDVRKMRVLVASANYPTLDGRKSMYYVHSRNLYYVRAGIEVVVLSFGASSEYIIDGIRVITEEQYAKNNDRYDVLLCHAANLRNHYKFLRKHDHNFKIIVFFFHGHEILHLNKYYPKPYDYMKRSFDIPIAQDIYDTFKIKTWKHYYKKNKAKLELVFVSRWIYNQFLTEFKIREDDYSSQTHIISNSVGEFFERNNYTPGKIEYDFISIRSPLDQSKYCVDIIVKLAEIYPRYKFCLIGKGNYFNFYDKPENLIWMNTELSHPEMMELLNKSRYALFPTREDTQGLMACELATFGMPLITSDIEVCKIVFNNCPNVYFMDNEKPNLEEAINNLKPWSESGKWEEYLSKNTVLREIELLKSLN